MTSETGCLGFSTGGASARSLKVSFDSWNWEFVMIRLPENDLGWTMVNLICSNKQTYWLGTNTKDIRMMQRMILETCIGLNKVVKAD